MSDKTLLIRKAAARGMSTIVALGLAILLSGCIIVPAGPYLPSASLLGLLDPVASATGGTAVVRSGGRPTAAAAALLEASILDHATAAFLSEGYAATSIEEIARQARVAKRTIYARWNGKPALFLGVLQRLVSGWILSADLWRETDDLEAALRVAARGILRVGLTQEAIALHRLMVAEAGRFPELRTIMAQAGYAGGRGPDRGGAGGGHCRWQVASTGYRLRCGAVPPSGAGWSATPSGWAGTVVECRSDRCVG